MPSLLFCSLHQELLSTILYSKHPVSHLQCQRVVTGSVPLKIAFKDLSRLVRQIYAMYAMLYVMSNTCRGWNFSTLDVRCVSLGCPGCFHMHSRATLEALYNLIYISRALNTMGSHSSKKRACEHQSFDNSAGVAQKTSITFTCTKAGHVEESTSSDSTKLMQDVFSLNTHTHVYIYIYIISLS